MGGICRVGWKLFAAAVGAVMSAGMWGCSDFIGGSDDVNYYLAEKRSGAKVVGFIDDSLVMVLDRRYWAEDRTTWNGVYSEKTGYQDARLCIYNYRVQEDGPRACDSISGDFSYSGQLTDSIIWYGMFGSRNSLHLWKFGGDVRYYSFNNALEVITEGCSASFDAAKAHQWFDGKFIVIGKQSLTAGNDSCQYAVLDTVGRTLVYKRLDENLKWIEKCDDVRAWGEDVYCFMPGANNFEAVLLRNNDSIDVPIKFTVGAFWGNVLKPNGHLCSLIEGNVDCFGTVWRGGLTFFEDEKIVVDLN